MKNNLYETIYNNQNHSLSLHHGGWEKCEPSHSFGPATRPHYLLHYIISGQGKYYVRDKCYELKSGDGFLICPSESTYYRADDINPWEYCWISFDGYEAINILKKCGLSKDNLILKDTSNGVFKQSLLSLLKGYEDNVSNELSLIGKFYLCFSSIYKEEINKEKDLTQNYVDKAIDYIYNNFSYDINVSNIANYVGIDRTYLYKLFMNNFNISPQKYLITFRLNTAINLLKTTDMNITEVSFSCGFKDIQSFCKHFKKQFNTTPTEYRKTSVLELLNT